MRWWFQCALAPLLLMSAAGQVQEVGDSFALKEQVKLLSIQLKALNTKHTMEIQSLKKEIVEMRNVAVSIAPPIAGSSLNQQRNSALTMRWLQDTLAELRGQMTELESSFNASEFNADQQRLRNEISVMFNEAANVAEQVEADGARISRIEVRLEETGDDLKQVRQLSAEAHLTCSKLSNELRFNRLKPKYKPPSKDVEKIHITVDAEVTTPTTETKSKVRKTRHLHFIRRQVQQLEHSFQRVMIYQQQVKAELLYLQQQISSGATAPKGYDDLKQKVELLMQEDLHRNEGISNITRDVSSLNKLHISMLELLESVESLENKIDTTIPEVQKEISKLDINLAQMNSQSSYLKEDQENIRQSVKAIAVSISNTVDKVNEYHDDLVEMNDTTNHLKEITNQHFYRLNDHILKSESNGLETNISSIELPELVNEIKDLQVIQKEYEDVLNRLPFDCSTVDGPSGIYLVAPGPGAPIETICDQKQTLLQNRFNGSVDFNRSFKEYSNGFGAPDTEFWIGNEALHRLTQNNCSSLIIELSDIYGKTWTASYEHFSVGPESDGFRLSVDGFSGNASDALDYQNNMEFSTIDHDRDISNTHCAANYEGGWWFSHCQHANLNGKYTLGLTWFDSFTNEWIAVATSKLLLTKREPCLIN